MVLGIFLLGNSLYIAWILAFMKYRRELDIRRFAQAAGEQSNLVQMVTAMQEIKLNNCETQKQKAGCEGVPVPHTPMQETRPPTQQITAPRPHYTLLHSI